MINDKLIPSGELVIVLRDQYGNIKEQKTVPNLIVTTGKNAIASRLAGTTTAVMSHLAVGSSSTAADVANTALGTQLGTRAALTVSGGSVSGNQVTFTATFNAGNGTGAIVEAGIFNAATAGTMLARTTFSVVNKDALDTLTISWVVTIS